MRPTLSPADRRELKGLALRLAAFALGGWLLLGVVFGVGSAPNDDMHPAMEAGDVYVYYRLQKNWRAGDLVCAKKQGHTVVGRVAAAQGDSVAITPQGRVMVNGALVLQREFGIKIGNMVTIHSYTNDQRILDMAHKDPRRARAAACNIIPTSTGAAQAVAKVIPELKGKFSGYSLRVPTPTVSVVDFSGILEKHTDTETVLAKLKEASETYLKGILEYNDKALVSMDFKGNPASSIVEAPYTSVQDGYLLKAVAWYDNEWGYSNRVCDLICLMKDKGL